MLTRELISPIIPALHPLDTGAKALRLMNECHLAHLPLVEEERYLGLVEESVILDWDDPEQSLQVLQGQYLKPAVQFNAHFFEALKLMSDFKLTVIPVVEEADAYLGVISQENLLYAVAHFDEIQEKGGILVLEMEPKDLLLSEITRLAESNDVNILGMHLYSNTEAGKLCVLLKTNRQDLNDFTATLQRFSYNIRYQFGENTSQELLRKNFDLFMHYINM